MDIKERLESGQPGLGLPDISSLVSPFWPNRNLNKPVISAVNGFALGGGFFLATTADLCVAAASAVFEITKVQRGGVAGWNFGFEHGLPQATAMELAFGGRLTARRADAVGLINEVAPDDQLMDTAMARAQKIAEIAPLVIRYNRELVSNLTPTVPDPMQRRATKYMEEVRHSADAAEAQRSFVEKRKPIWRGR